MTLSLNTDLKTTTDYSFGNIFTATANDNIATLQCNGEKNLMDLSAGWNDCGTLTSKYLPKNQPMFFTGLCFRAGVLYALTFRIFNNRLLAYTPTELSGVEIYFQVSYFTK